MGIRDGKSEEEYKANKTKRPNYRLRDTLMQSDDESDSERFKGIYQREEHYEDIT